ncbi:hypothetical protein PVL29_018525 [Vitis rotundifolia]|uniref:Uncharacterized protein n=1 Tax=Vitis rotundifolia TaxID=103349 RepID=A0AA38Z584_VITRO|nr:hypothetical protein PVL29_018525 [Vitis rotundifolia]
MRAFITHRVSGSEELRAKLEQVGSDLAAVQKAATDGAEALKLAEWEKEAVCAEVDWLKEEDRVVETKCKEAEQENA